MVNYVLESPLLQLTGLILCIILAAFLTSLVTLSFRRSLNFLMDPGTFAGTSENLDWKGFGTGLALTITGMLIFGGLISVLNNAFQGALEESRLQKIHDKISGAFEMPSYSMSARRFLSKHDMHSSSRGYAIEDLEFELELSRQDILASINLFRGFRIRQVFEHKYIAVEQVYANRSFGSALDRDESVTLICTLPLTARYLGHFSYVLAQNLSANYLSNEFYDGGHLDKAMRRSFTTHPDNLKFESPEHNAHQAFFDELKRLSDKTSLFVYSGYTKSKAHSFLVSCAGDSEGASPENMCEQIPNFAQHFETFKEQSRGLNFSVAMKADKRDRPTHLALNIRERLGKPVLVLYSSESYLGGISETRYYEGMKIIRDFVRALRNEMKGVKSESP